MRITTQLVQANPEKHLWADGYERDLRDILTLQSEVARAIAQEIRVKLTPQEEAGLAWARPVDPEAHEAYFKGRYHYDKFSPDSWDKAIEYFKLAIQKDPDFAPAHAWLAQSYFQLGFLQLKPVGEVMGDAKAAALKAVELDETIFQAHIVLARIRFHYERNWLAAQNEIKRAIELSPGSGQAKGLYALYLGAVGRLDEAISEAKQARELDPLWLPIKMNLAWLYYVTGNNDEAIEQCREALDMTPSFFWAHFFLWRTLEQKMMYEEAVEQCQSMFALLGNHDVAEAVERRYRESGYKSAMGMAARGMARQLKSREVSPFLIALMYIHAGEMDQAFQWTERAYDERDTWMFSLKMDPAFAPLRDDPRFQELLRRMNYPE